MVVAATVSPVHFHLMIWASGIFPANIQIISVHALFENEGINKRAKKNGLLRF